jgi:calcineurin-like phosphoesterase family protein
MAIYFTADTHFGHSGLLMHQSDRMIAFECVEEMDAQLIDQINSVVRPNDELYHLGDFCWQASRAGHYRQRLKVRKLHIVCGNHDAISLWKHVSSMKDMICRKFRYNDNTVKIHMCHYPLLSWRALHHGGYHLYGHSHGNYEKQLDEIFPGRRSMDVSIDNIYRLYNEWRPINLEEVIERLGIEKVEGRIPGPFEEINNENCKS